MKKLMGAGTALVVLVLCAGCASTGPYVRDAMTTMRVSAHLAGAGLPTDKIDVRTFDGAVKLSGFVPSTDIQQRAIATARQVSGVEQVVDHITVIDHPPMTGLSAGSGRTR